MSRKRPHDRSAGGCNPRKKSRQNFFLVFITIKCTLERKKTGEIASKSTQMAPLGGILRSTFFLLYLGMSTKAPNVAIEGSRLRKMSQISMSDVQVR